MARLVAQRLGRRVVQKEAQRVLAPQFVGLRVQDELVPQRVDRPGRHGHKLLVAAQAGHEVLAQAPLDKLTIAGVQVRVGFAQLALQKAGQGRLADVALAHCIGPLDHQCRDDDSGNEVQDPGPAQVPGAGKEAENGRHPHANGQQHDLAAPAQQNVVDACHRPSIFCCYVAISRRFCD
ncbi:hypothetical protein D3C71_1476340 [compost metagenome]